MFGKGVYAVFLQWLSTGKRLGDRSCHDVSVDLFEQCAENKKNGR